MRPGAWPAAGLAALLAAGASLPPPVHAAQREAGCDIPAVARDIWRCRDGWVIGPQNEIVRLPIAERDAETLYRAGLAAAERADWRAAIAYFTAAHQRAHLVPKYQYNLGLAHARAGNEVAAVAWLAAFLVAAPDAPNRGAIWSQIAELEAQARQEAEPIWAAAVKAVEALPLPTDGQPQRATGYWMLADAAAGAQDWSRARSLGERYQSFDRWGGDIDTFLRGRRDAARSAAIRIYDLESAEALTRAIGSEPPNEPDPARLRALRSGQRPRLEWKQQSNFFRGPVLAAFDRGDRAAFQSAGEAGSVFRLAVEGRSREAFAVVRKTPPDGWIGTAYPGLLASRAGEILLLNGDVDGAVRAAALARRYIRKDDSFFAMDIPRLEALILAERGKVDEARSRLLALASRFNREGVYSDDDNRCCIGLSDVVNPQQQWFEYRHYPTAQLAGLLFWRGRTEQALALADELDSIRRLAVLDYGRAVARSPQERDSITRARERTLREAAGGETLPTAQAAKIEDAVVTARRLPGGAYGIEAWLAQTAKEPNAFRQVTNLVLPAQDLALGLRMIRISYQRSGGTWGGGR
jgi:hypothetical protein